MMLEAVKPTTINLGALATGFTARGNENLHQLRKIAGENPTDGRGLVEVACRLMGNEGLELVDGAAYFEGLVGNAALKACFGLTDFGVSEIFNDDIATMFAGLADAIEESGGW